MSRTFRNVPGNLYYRAIRTKNEIAQNVQLHSDIRANDIPYFVSKLNRTLRHIPTSWDDVQISARNEQKS